MGYFDPPDDPIDYTELPEVAEIAAILPDTLPDDVRDDILEKVVALAMKANAECPACQVLASEAEAQMWGELEDAIDDIGNCPHNTSIADCQPCLALSDFLYDASRERQMIRV